MKITDPEVIKNGEKDLIDAVKEDLDLEVVRDILKERMTAAPLASSGGEIVVHDNQVAFRLDFKINLSGSLLFDRQGNFIEGITGQEPDKQEAYEKATGPEETEMVQESETLPLTGAELDQELESEGVEDKASSDQGFENGPGEDFDINLPDYDLEDQEEDETYRPELETRDFQIEDEEDDILVTDALNEETDLEAAEPGDPSQEDELADLDLDEPEPDTQEPEDGDLEGMEDQTGEEALDDDINNILKESQDFWEKKEE